MGYRLRMTLAFAVLSVTGVALFTVLFLSNSYREFKADRIASVERMTACLAGNLYWDMRTGELDRVDEALARFAEGVPAPTPPVVMVIDDQAGLYASTTTAAGTARDETGLGSSLALLADYAQARDGQAANDAAATLQRPTGFITAAQIARDGEQLGSVLVDYPFSSLDRTFSELFLTSTLYSLLLLPLLLAIGWLIGRRLGQPIERLRQCMARVGTGDLEVACTGIRSRDEIGDLARGFEEMVASLREKRLIEKEMMSTERLVAVGQVAAGVAHEINNPLGGMLNAVSTFKRHGADPQVAAKTVDLLERGLKQIQSIVSALLVQARVESHSLGAADLQDLRMLIAAQVRKKRIQLDWHCAIGQGVPLPATAVRQVLLNLLLNAIQVTPDEGRVQVRCEPHPEPGARHLLLRVEDQGPGIDPEEVERLFEPFYSATGGHGLGLWVTYQIISQLGGSIEVRRRDGDAAPADARAGTCFEVRLPYPRGTENRSTESEHEA